MASNKPYGLSDDWEEITFNPAEWEEITPTNNQPPTFLQQVNEAAIDQLPSLIGMAGAGAGMVPTIAPLIGGPFGGAAIGGYLGQASKDAINTLRGSNQAPQSYEEIMAGPLESGLYSAAGEAVGQKVIGPAVGLAAKGIQKGAGFVKDKLGAAADKFLPKFGKVLGNIPEAYTEEYLKRRGQINARPLEEIMTDLLTLREEQEKLVTAAKGKLSDARYSEQKAREALRTRERQLLNELDDIKYKLSLDAESANQIFNYAFTLAKENLKSKDVASLAPKVIDAIKALKDKVNADSAESYDILSKRKGNISLQPLLYELQLGIDKLKLRGIALTDTDELAIAAIEKTINRIRQLGRSVTFPEAKFILQRLDHDTQYTVGAGSYAKEIDGIKQKARQALDESIKNKSKRYQAIMKDVFENTKLLNELNDKFGTLDLAVGRLSSINSVKGKNIDFDLLQKLGEQTKRDFKTPIIEYIKSREILASPSKLKDLQKVLPEYKAASKLKAERKKYIDPKIRRDYLEKAKKTPEGKALKEAIESLSDAESDLVVAEQKFKPYSNISQKSVQSKVKALTGARNFDAERIFSDIDKASGKNFTQEIKDRAILDSFNKSDTQGSRKVLLGKVVGAGVGSTLGSVAGKAGESVGAVTGFSLDKYSGRIIKGILDGRISSGNALRALGDKYGRFTETLVKAAELGPQVFNNTLRNLMNDPEFQKKLFSLENDGNSSEYEPNSKINSRLKALEE